MINYDKVKVNVPLHRSYVGSAYTSTLFVLLNRNQGEDHILFRSVQRGSTDDETEDKEQYRGIFL